MLCHIVVGIFAVVGALVVWLFFRPAACTALIASPSPPSAGCSPRSGPAVGRDLRLHVEHAVREDHRVRHYLFPTDFWWLFVFAPRSRSSPPGPPQPGALRDLHDLPRSSRSCSALWPEAHAWNLRFLPFWYVGLFLLAGIGAAKIPALARRVVEWVLAEPELDGPGRCSPHAAVLGAGAAALVVVLLTGVTLTASDATKGFLSFWADWNYSATRTRRAPRRRTTGRRRGRSSRP